MSALSLGTPGSVLTTSEKDGFSKMPYPAARDSSVEPGAAEMLPAGDWSDHVMLVLFGAGILNIPQKTEKQGYFWLGAVSFLGMAIH